MTPNDAFIADFDSLKDGAEPLSGKFLRLVRRAVTVSFCRMQATHEKNYCDADVEDVSQEVVLELIRLFRRKDVADKTSYLITMTYRYARYCILAHYRRRFLIAKARLRSGEPSPSVSYVATDEPDVLSWVDRRVHSNWPVFEQRCRDRLPERLSDTAINLAGTGQSKLTAQIVGVSETTVLDRKRSLRQLLAKHPDCKRRCGGILSDEPCSRLRGGLEPVRLSKAC